MRAIGLCMLLAAMPAWAVPPAEKPGDPQAVEAVRLIEQGRPALSVPMLEAVLARLPGDPDLLTYLALALRQTGEFTAAEARYAEALAADPWHAAALAYQGVLYLETGRRERAVANLETLRGLCPAGCTEREELQRALARPASITGG